MDFIVVNVLLFGSVLGFGIWMYKWQLRTAEANLKAWARNHHYELLEMVRANPIGTGPGVRSTNNKQVIYRILVSNEHGARRYGIAKVGSKWSGVLSNDLLVEWDGDPLPAAK